MSLEITGLSRKFGSKWALRDVEFTAREGRVLGLLGESASGKSTVLRLIAGQDEPTLGRIMRGSIDLTRIKAKERDVTLLGERDSDPRGFGLFHRAATESSAERQLRALDEAVAKAGSVLLLDEPFCRMDAEVRDECFSAVRRAARSRDRIVIFATSDFQQVAAVADDVAVLAGAGIGKTGSPAEVYDDPETIATAQLTGECNLIKARRLTSSDDALPEFYTVDGGHRIFAQKTEKNRMGAINQTVTLAIRPEQVAMSLGASFPEDNLLRGVVTAIRFRGATSLVEFDASGLKVEARVFKIVGLNVGDECMLGLPPHRILILKD